MSSVTLKQQTIRAGDLTIEIGGHGDMERTPFMKVTTKTESRMLLFTTEGDILRIIPVKLEGEPPIPPDPTPPNPIPPDPTLPNSRGCK